MLLNPSCAYDVNFVALREAGNQHSRISARALAAVKGTKIQTCARDTHKGLVAVAIMLGRNHVPRLADLSFVAQLHVIDVDDES